MPTRRDEKAKTPTLHSYYHKSRRHFVPARMNSNTTMLALMESLRHIHTIPEDAEDEHHYRPHDDAAHDEATRRRRNEDGDGRK